MSILDLSDFDNGTMDKEVEYLNLLHDTFLGTTLTAFVVNRDIPINHVGKVLGIRSKYIDLSQTSKGDYNRFAQHLNQFKYDGLVIDNVFALKRETEYSMLPFGDCINFNEMHIAVRCKEYPEYIKGKSLQMIIIGV